MAAFEPVQVALEGDLVLVHPEDVVYDADGKPIAVRPRGHGLGSEGEYEDAPPSVEHRS
jgi:hypothetical protein